MEDMAKDLEYLKSHIKELKANVKSLAEELNSVNNATKGLAKDIKIVNKEIEECCSGSVNKERILAHKTLDDTVGSLEKVVSKLDSIEKQHIKFSMTITEIKELKNSIAQLRMYGYMAIGGVVVIEIAVNVFNVAKKLITT